MKETTVDLEIFSPRWGHKDIYKIVLTQEYMTINLMQRISKCKWVENFDPEWTGENLHDTMNNDHIYPPEIFQDLIEHAWLSWRNGEINDIELNEELQHLAKWLNLVTENKPNSEFWKAYF